MQQIVSGLPECQNLPENTKISNGRPLPARAVMGTDGTAISFIAMAFESVSTEYYSNFSQDEPEAMMAVASVVNGTVVNNSGRFYDTIMATGLQSCKHI